ncbi:hypothetical protein [Flavobacterium denitrificans]|uniref:hypothetical protein n=1 Tax=Flavobacterium denitrificans TaxID=281361 RepID=UPI0003F6CF16|nr:hypothetical protein [Flavobacterium denitrificans]
MKPEVKYIGQKITLKTIRDCILDLKLSEDRIILLNSQNFDDIVLEYLDFYNESIEIPYYLLGVLISEDNSNKVPLNRIGIINDDDFEHPVYYEENFDLSDGEEAYRCGFCGRIIDKHGNELFDDERERIINYIQKFEDSIVNKAYGKCCKNQW